MMVTRYVLAALILLASPAASDRLSFVRSCSVTGGSAQSLAGVLSACGYKGAPELERLTVWNNDDSPNDLAVGGSDLNQHNGYKLAPGESKRWRESAEGGPVRADKIFLYVPASQGATIWLRSK
jgi:hypothetical protein